MKKHYFVDNGLLSIFLFNGDTALLENLCAIHLRKRYGEELCYYNRNVEVDFLIAEEGYAIQASYSIYGEGMQDTFEREIVTNDEEGTVPLENGKQIEVIPAWKWLLE